MIKKLICLASLFVVLAACGEKPTPDSRLLDEGPTLFPDYTGVTIPWNIAPLNFRVEGEPDRCYARVSGSTQGEIECTGKNKIRFNAKAWRRLLAANKGGELTVNLSVKHQGQWSTYAPFTIAIAAEAIDSHLAYRLIEPGYEEWHIMGLYQRDLESFREKTIIRNDMVGYNCINCHAFCGGDPQQMMFHMRAANGGTYILQDDAIEKLNTKTPQTISHLTYPYWHPSGRYITTSVNDIKQFFHAVKEKKVEVFDLESDVVVYDVKNKEILANASLISSEAFETFPSFSPDGEWLYFCSAPAVTMPEAYAEVRYHLCRVAFDPEKGTIQLPVDTLVHADTHSVSFPRISPDGRFLMYTETGYGQFPIWHRDAEIRMLDLQRGEPVDMIRLNSPDTESYHSWSSNSRWAVVSSRRDNGLYTLPYLVYINPQGEPAKPFLLPQQDPDHYDYLMYSYNLPELIRGEVTVDPYAIQHIATQGTAEEVRFR